jgi:hypothetical protein
MTWPTDDLTTAQLDAGTDDPSQARVEILSLANKVKALITGAVSTATALTAVLRDVNADTWVRYLMASKVISDIAATDGNVVVSKGTDGTDALFTGALKGNIKSSNGAVILSSGTNGADAWFIGTLNGNISGSSVTARSAFNATDIPNGYFENGLTGWTTAASSTGTVTLDVDGVLGCKNAVKMTSIGAGGGTAISDYFPVAGAFDRVNFDLIHKVSNAGLDTRVVVFWYDKTKVLLGGGSAYTMLYNVSSVGPTTADCFKFYATPPATAAYARIELTGSVSGDTTSGSAWFSGLSRDMCKALSTPMLGDITFTSAQFSNNNNWTNVGTLYINVPVRGAGVTIHNIKLGAYDTGGGVADTYAKVVVGGVESAATTSGGLIGGWVDEYVSVTLTAAQVGTGAVAVVLWGKTGSGANGVVRCSLDSTSYIS